MHVHSSLDEAVSSKLFRNIGLSGDVFFRPGNLSGRQVSSMSRKQVVNNARRVEAFSEHIRGGIDRKVDMVVGPQFTLRATPNFKKLGITDKKVQREIRDQLETVFYDWGYDQRRLMDAEGHYDFGGLMWAGMRALSGPDAEVAFIVHVDNKRAKAYGTKWATFIQHLDTDRIETPAAHSLNPRVADGFVRDKYGRVVGFFARNIHPGEAGRGFDDHEHTLIPRETKTGRPIGVHWFTKTRPTQLRGVSTLVTILKQSGMLDEFDDGYLGAASINQMLATYVQSYGTPEDVAKALAPQGEGEAARQVSMLGAKLDFYEKAGIKVGGHRIPVLPPGDEIKMSSVNRAINDPTLFRNVFLRQFASAVGISFEQLSKNFSDSNYSAARAALLDIWQGIMRMRKWYGSHVAAPIYRAVLEEAFLKGMINLPAGAPSFASDPFAWSSCEWTGPGFPQIDPEKEARAAKEFIGLNLESRTEIAAQRGRDLGDVFNEIETEQREAAERGIDLTIEKGPPGKEEPPTPQPSEAGAKKSEKSPRSQKAKRDGDGDGEIGEGEKE